MRLYLEPHKIGDDIVRGWVYMYVWGVEACFLGSENKIHGCEYMQVKTARSLKYI